MTTTETVETETKPLLNGYEAANIEELTALKAASICTDIEAFLLPTTCDEPDCETTPSHALVEVVEYEGYNEPYAYVCEDHLPKKTSVYINPPHC